MLADLAAIVRERAYLPTSAKQHTNSSNSVNPNQRKIPIEIVHFLSLKYFTQA
jgi:hypothetical protein